MGWWQIQSLLGGKKQSNQSIIYHGNMLMFTIASMKINVLRMNIWDGCEFMPFIKWEIVFMITITMIFWINGEKYMVQKVSEMILNLQIHSFACRFVPKKIVMCFALKRIARSTWHATVAATQRLCWFLHHSTLTRHELTAHTSIHTQLHIYTMTTRSIHVQNTHILCTPYATVVQRLAHPNDA